RDRVRAAAEDAPAPAVERKANRSVQHEQERRTDRVDMQVAVGLTFLAVVEAAVADDRERQPEHGADETEADDRTTTASAPHEQQCDGQEEQRVPLDHRTDCEEGE